MEREAFYSTVAQVIPVLFLVIAWEARVFDVLMRRSLSDRLLAVFALSIVFVGEGAALVALDASPESQRVQDLIRNLVWTAISVEAAIIALLALFGHRPQERDDDD